MTQATIIPFSTALLLLFFARLELPAQPLDSLQQQPYLTLRDSLANYKKQNIEDIRFLEITEPWILIDSTGKLDIEDVAGPKYASRFSPNALKGKPFPVGPGVWVRLRLRGASKLAVQQYEIFIHDYFFKTRLFERNEPGQFITRQNGHLFYPWFSAWPHRKFNAITLNENTRKELYIRLERSGSFRVKMYDLEAGISIRICSEQTFSPYWWKKNITDYFFSGLFLCLFILFLILMWFVKDPSLKWLTFTVPLFLLSTSLNLIGHFVPDVLFVWIKQWTFFGCFITFSNFMDVYSRQRMYIPTLNRIYRIWPVFVFLFPLLLNTLIDFFVSPSRFPNLSSRLDNFWQPIFLFIFLGSGLLIMTFVLSIIFKNRDERNIFLVLLLIFWIYVIGPGLLNIPDIFRSGLAYISGLRILFAVFVLAFAQIIGKQYKTLQEDKLALQQSLNRKLEAQVRVRTAELLEKNQRLIKLDQEKNNLIDIVAHDLGSPLASIKMYSGIVQKAKDKLTAKHREYLDGISATAQRSVEMIRRILDVNAIDQNGPQFELQPTDILPILEDAVNEIRGLVGRKDIQVVTEWPGEPVVMNIDPAAFRQVIDNLISNAIKFSPKGKMVTIGLDTSGNQNAPCIYVCDQGPGIASKDMPKLFQRYARLSAQPTAGETSTGLGLAIVKQYVEAMSGRVWAENNEEEGATFWVEL